MIEKKEKTFEVSIKELEKIVQDLENGDIDLDNSINKYTEAMKLIKECETKLDKATKTINKIVAENGNIQDFNIEE